MNHMGSCNCGDVTFQIKTPLSDVYMCHCSICRKSTGGGGVAVAIINKDQFSWTQGQNQIKSWSKPGHEWDSNFCSNCGSPLPGNNDDNSIYLPVGLLDSGYQGLQLKHHLFVDSKASWEILSNSATKHNNNFESDKL